ncbi:MAG: monovalent cation:proton antiporter-2 (CPA2) family protein [Pseudomonadota bacterium]
MDAGILFTMFAFLAAACFVVPLMRLVGLGSVVGYLFAGILIGPGVLGLIEDTDTILHISEFGVVMMLFLIGLELQPRELWAMRNKLVGMGGLQVGITLAIIATVCFALGYQIGDSIVIGMAFSLSSTAVALQVMQDRNMLNTSPGQSAFSVLLFQDVIVIAMIAALPFVASFAAPEAATVTETGDHSHDAMIRPTGIWLGFAIIGVFAGMIIGGRLVLNRIFRLIARGGVRETFTAMALSLVVGAALLMDWLGLSAALGAFIAGVVLADSDYRHQLERDIEPFKALLLGLFFMSVGMSIEFDVLVANPALIIGGVAGLMLIKFSVLYTIGQIFKLAKSADILFAIVICQAGEFGFVLFEFARAEGLLSPDLKSQLYAIIALSMALTPIILLLHDRFIAPRFADPNKGGEAPVNEGSNVLILGFGRVGQLVARLLHTQDVKTTLIDHDGDHIEFVRQFGNRVYYGDATDIDLLRIAGAAETDVIVVAVDDEDSATRAVKLIREHFPNAKIVARARNRTHVFTLMEKGADYIERETVRGALSMGRHTLEMLNVTAERARELSDNFLAFDEKLIEESFEDRNDLEKLIETAATNRELLKETLNADAEREQQDSAA